MNQKENIAMFNDIALKYDLINNILSLGIHKIWKKKAISFLKLKSNGKYLDLCCGTGDLAKLISKYVSSPGKVTGLDLSPSMLNIARRNYHNIEWISADASSLPFDENSLDGIIIGFGIRNIYHRHLALKECHRCLKPNANLIVLEFSLPKNKILFFL